MMEYSNEPKPDSNEVEIEAFGIRKNDKPERERYAVYIWLAERRKELDYQAKAKESKALRPDSMV